MFFTLGSVCATDNDNVTVGSENSDEESDYVLNSDEKLLKADSSDDVLGNSTDDSGNETEPVIQNASFKYSKQSNYIIGDTHLIKLLDENGTGISNKTIYFEINGKILNSTTNNAGTAKLILKDLKKGSYTINFIFNETGYNPIVSSKKILLLSKTTSTLTASKKLTVYAGIKKTLKITLKVDGINLQGATVKFTVNKKTYYKKTNSKGHASFTVYLHKGTYTITSSYAGMNNIDPVKASTKVTSKLYKNPYNTKYRRVVIDTDGGFTQEFLKDVARKLRMAGWKVVVKGIGPDQHSKNYKNVYNSVYMPFYNGLCAGTILEMARYYYGGVIKSHNSVLTPAWYTDDWTSEKMSQYRNDITKITYLKRAWDDNFSPASFKGMSYPANYMTKNNIKYCVGDTTYGIVEQFLYGGWVAHH